MIQPPKNYPVLDLTNDRNFKHFFSRDRDVLLSLLKTFLPLPDKQRIQNVDIISDKKIEAKNTLLKKAQRQDLVQKPLGSEKSHAQPASSSKAQDLILKDSALYPSSIDGKQSILDLNVQLNTGEKVDVEIHPRVGGDKGFSTVLSSILACKEWYFTGLSSIPLA